MAGKQTAVDMTHGPLAKKILFFALPLAASSVLQQLFNAADLAVVGRFANAQAMAAVGSNGAVINLLVSLFVGMSVGANVLIGNLIGAGHRERVREAVHTSVLLALVAGIFLLGLGIILTPFILHLMSAPEDVMSLAILYLRIYFCGMPAIMMYNFAAAILRSKGDSKRPFYSLTAAGILNIALNLLFVVVFHLSVVGVALATVISNYFSGILTMLFLVREKDEFHLEPGKLLFFFRRPYLIKVLQIGVPAGLQGMVFSLSNVVIQTAVNSFGANCIAGMTAAQNVDFISYCFLNAFSQATVTFVSQNYGAGNIGRCRRVLRTAMIMGVGLDMVLVACLYLARVPFIGFFTKDPNVISYAMIRVTYSGLFHFMCATYEIPAGAMRGMNRSMVPALISMLGTCAFRLLYVFTYFPAHRSVETLVMVYPLSWVMTCIVMNTACQLVFRKAEKKT